MANFAARQGSPSNDNDTGCKVIFKWPGQALSSLLLRQALLHPLPHHFLMFLLPYIAMALMCAPQRNNLIEVTDIWRKKCDTITTQLNVYITIPPYSDSCLKSGLHIEAINQVTGRMLGRSNECRLHCHLCETCLDGLTYKIDIWISWPDKDATQSWHMPYLLLYSFCLYNILEIEFAQTSRSTNKNIHQKVTGVFPVLQTI